MRYAAHMRTLLVAAFLLACCAPAALAKGFTVTEADFQCIKDWPKLEGHKTRIFNRNRHRLKKALRVLKKGKRGRHYPVGTIVELIPPVPGLVRGEAMVKHEKGFNPEGNDWEFFVLAVNPDHTTRIVKQGGADVANIGPPCQTCHSAAKAFDFVCETDHGCVPLDLTPEAIAALQDRDPRCQPAP
jgi:hypothetical protein